MIRGPRSSLLLGFRGVMAVNLESLEVRGVHFELLECCGMIATNLEFVEVRGMNLELLEFRLRTID